MLNWSFNSGKIYFIVELLIAELIFLFPATKRKYFWAKLLGGMVILSLLMAVFPIMGWEVGQFNNSLYQLFTYLFFFGLSVILMAVCFKLKAIPLIAMCSAGYAVQHLSYHAGVILNISEFVNLLPKTEFLTKGRICELIMMVICYLIIFFSFGWYSAKHECYKNTDKRYAILTFIILFICIVISRFYRYFGGTGLTNDIYAITCCLLALYIQILMHKMESMSRETAILQQINQSEKKQYAISRKTMELINVKYHDLKHILKEGNVTPEMLSEIEQEVKGLDMMYHTGNEVLDTILTEKSLACKDQGIKLTFMGSGKDVLFMKTMDVYSLFGNAVENAIEAVTKLDEEEKKIVGITVEKRGGMVVVSVVNYYDGNLLQEDGKLLTVKNNDKGNHGYGMKSMKLIAEKYNGDISYTAKDELFTLNVYLMEPINL